MSTLLCSVTIGGKLSMRVTSPHLAPHKRREKNFPLPLAGGGGGRARSDSGHPLTPALSPARRLRYSHNWRAGSGAVSAGDSPAPPVRSNLLDRFNAEGAEKRGAPRRSILMRFALTIPRFLGGPSRSSAFLRDASRTDNIAPARPGKPQMCESPSERRGRGRVLAGPAGPVNPVAATPGVRLSGPGPCAAQSTGRPDPTPLPLPRTRAGRRRPPGSPLPSRSPAARR